MRGWWCVVVFAGCGFQLDLSSTSQDAPNDKDAAVTGDDALIDASIDAPVMIDAPPALVCPLNYNVTIAATSSRYRFKKTAGSPAAQANDCADDGTGTHIVSLDSQAEITALAQLAVTSGGWPQVPEHTNDTFIWVGGVQRRPQQTLNQLDSNWITVAGAPLISSWGTDEPNDWDQTDGVEDNEEQLLVLWLDTLHLADMVKRFNYGVICECDGLEPSTAFENAWDVATGN